MGVFAGSARRLSFLPFSRSQSARSAAIHPLGLAALLEENGMLKLNMTYWRYGHDEIEAACGGEVAMTVRSKVMKRRDEIIAANDRTQARGAPEQRQTDRRNPASPVVTG
jgi:hypothetical protein